MAATPHTLFRRVLHFFGKVGIALLVSALWWEILDLYSPASGWIFVAQAGVLVSGIWLLVRLLRLAAQALVWRLRNRLVVTYLFIGLMPLLLVIGLVGLGGYLLAGQLGAYLVTSELDRRVEALEVAARRAMEAPSDAPLEDPNLPGLEILRVDAGSGPEWRGAVLRGDNLYLMRALRSGSNEVRALVPLDATLLGSLVPDLGAVGVRGRGGEHLGGNRPEKQGFFDPEIDWAAGLAVADWDHMDRPSAGYFLAVLTRTSAIRMVFFSRSSDAFQAGVQVALVALLIAFLVVELICYVIGIGMTRTITNAVHNLYEGTQKVMTGDFSARIAVNGRDQLAELSHSFNEMTANVERLLAVAKEKERLQSEIEIASEVQAQLFPRALPKLQTLKITAICRAARLVSGDYYDYAMLGDRVTALAIGDVAGKGLVPIVEGPSGTWDATFFGTPLHLEDEAAVSDLEARLRVQGLYPYRCTPEEADALAASIASLADLQDLAQERWGHDAFLVVPPA